MQQNLLMPISTRGSKQIATKILKFFVASFTYSLRQTGYWLAASTHIKRRTQLQSAVATFCGRRTKAPANQYPRKSSREMQEVQKNFVKHFVKNFTKDYAKILLK